MGAARSSSELLEDIRLQRVRVQVAAASAALDAALANTAGNTSSGILAEDLQTSENANVKHQKIDALRPRQVEESSQVAKKAFTRRAIVRSGSSPQLKNLKYQTESVALVASSSDINVRQVGNTCAGQSRKLGNRKFAKENINIHSHRSRKKTTDPKPFTFAKRGKQKRSPKHIRNRREAHARRAAREARKGTRQTRFF